MKIQPATKAHAPLIAKAVMMAVGDEICADFAAPDHTVDDVERLFTHLAELDDSQYSYRNTLVAVTPDGEVAGVCVAYDGAMLHPMRQHFFNAAKSFLGRDMEGMSDETSADEFYLDTLAVWPQFRGRGIATALIEATVERARTAGKPAALLVDYTNPRAEALYTSLGFRHVDDRPFAGVTMKHLKHPTV